MQEHAHITIQPQNQKTLAFVLLKENEGHFSAVKIFIKI